LTEKETIGHQRKTTAKEQGRKELTTGEDQTPLKLKM